MTLVRLTVGVLSLLAVSGSTKNTTDQDSFDMPAGVSTQCSSFLDTVNSDPSLNACISSVLSATAAFNSSNTAPTQSQVQSAISQLCSGNSSCNTDDIRTQLTGFSQNCANELQSIPDVLSLYDVLYTLKPLSDAICTQDPTTNQLCILQASSVGNNTLPVPEDGAQQPLTPDLNEFGQAYLAFLFVSPDTEQSVLCSVCTQTMLSNYIAFESSIQYALGLDASPLLQGQSQLWQAIQSACGQNFTSTVVSNVENAQGQTTTSAGTPRSELSSGALVAAAVFSVVFVFV